MSKILKEGLVLFLKFEKAPFQLTDAEVLLFELLREEGVLLCEVRGVTLELPHLRVHVLAHLCLANLSIVLRLPELLL